MYNTTETEAAKLTQLQHNWWIQNHRIYVYCVQDFYFHHWFWKNLFSNGIATPLLSLSLSLLSGIVFYYTDSQQLIL
jgi:hypothetical protein